MSAFRCMLVTCPPSVTAQSELSRNHGVQHPPASENSLGQAGLRSCLLALLNSSSSNIRPRRGLLSTSFDLCRSAKDEFLDHVIRQPSPLGDECLWKLTTKLHRQNPVGGQQVRRTCDTHGSAKNELRKQFTSRAISVRRKTFVEFQTAGLHRQNPVGVQQSILSPT